MPKCRDCGLLLPELVSVSGSVTFTVKDRGGQAEMSDILRDPSVQDRMIGFCRIAESPLKVLKGRGFVDVNLEHSCRFFIHRDPAHSVNHYLDYYYKIRTGLDERKESQRVTRKSALYTTLAILLSGAIGYLVGFLTTS